MRHGNVSKLAHLVFEANLLKYAKEINELAGAAVKKEQVKVKLATIADDWADQVFEFAEYKNHGPVIPTRPPQASSWRIWRAPR